MSLNHIFSSLQSTLARKQYTPHMLARIALNELAVLLEHKKLEGYLRYGVLYVDLDQQSDIITLFAKKNQWLLQINAQIQKYNTQVRIKDIRHKKIKPSEGNGDGYD